MPKDSKRQEKIKTWSKMRKKILRQFLPTGFDDEKYYYVQDDVAQFENNVW